MPITKIDIRRYRPEKRETYWQSYEVGTVESTTVLEALMSIKDYQDGSLAFRRSCRSGICGSCAMRINGFEQLACQTKALEESARFGYLKIEPLGNLTPEKDLIVDFEPFFEQLAKANPWLTPYDPLPEKENPMTVAQQARVKKMADCIYCSCCYSSCNVAQADRDFPGPAAIVKAARFAFDVRDSATEQRAASMTDEGMWWCSRCQFCTAICPKAIPCQEVIIQLKNQAFKDSDFADKGSRRTRAVLKDVAKTGRINEFTLPFSVEGIGGLRQLPLAIKLLFKGKLPSPLRRPIDGIEEVKKIIGGREK